MTTTELLRWQWDGYQHNHKSAWNLLFHALMVPLFVGGNLLLVPALALRHWPAAIVGIAAMGLSLAVQGWGHGLERHSPEPFTGMRNVVLRILFEQWITFPRFVLSGAWFRALRAALRHGRGNSRHLA